jgi:hypothetical protein
MAEQQLVDLKAFVLAEAKKMADDNDRFMPILEALKERLDGFTKREDVLELHVRLLGLKKLSKERKDRDARNKEEC